MKTIPHALGAMAPFAQFMIYKLVPSKRPGKMDKLPCYINGDVTDPHNSTAWVSGEVACAEASRRGEGWGVAFVLTEHDPFFFFDIDDCLKDGQWNSVATELCQMFAGAAVEVSQSGRGLHILGTGKPSVHTDERMKKANTIIDGKKVNLFDLYTESRFIALTGKNIVGDVGSNNHQFALDTIVNRYLRHEEIKKSDWTTNHVPESCPIVDDEKLIAKACATTSAAGIFGSKANFKDLWHKNEEVLNDCFPPDQGGEGFDASAADAALAQHLSFWCGGNCQRIYDLMHKSALVRDKWQRKDYMQRTILGAVSRQSTWYSVGAPIEVVAPERVVEASEPVVRSGFQFIGGTQLAEMFRGCVYVAKYHSILAPNGMMYKSEQFNTLYGGYTFTLDESNEKTTRKAWEAFTESQLYTFSKVDDINYDPDTAFGSIVTEDGLKYVNAFKPTTDTGIEGDVSLFINHVRKLCPLDHNILLDWMAWKVQHPGECMRWAPVIVGAPGNGKTTVADAMMLVMGKRHSTVVQSSDVDNKFNGWVHGNTFAVINDFKVGDKRDVIEILKPIVTDRTIPFQKKGIETDTCRNMLGIIITSNHRDAVMKTKDDRRYATFITPHETAEDILRDGMDEHYYAELDHFMRNPLSASYLRHYFHNRNVGRHPNRAPETSSTALAIDAALGSVEQEVLEAIEEGRQGFMGGWVSSKALDNLLKQMRADRQVPPSRRRDMMRSLGYDWHPGLKDGRVNNVILIDGGKPRLYIKLGHIHANLQGAAEIARHYQIAQGDMGLAAQMQG